MSKETSTGKNKWLRRLLIWGPMLTPVVFLVVYFGWPLARVWSAQNTVVQMAYDLAPKQYPNSKLVYQWQSGGPTTSWDRRTYQTSDSLDKALEFMKAQGFEFELSERSDVNGPVYRAYKCNATEAAIEQTRLLVGEHYPWYDKDENLPVPCASVTVYTSNENTGATLIEVWLDWPAL